MDKTNTPYQIKKIVDIYHVVATHASRVLAMKTTCSSPAFAEQSFFKAFEGRHHHGCPGTAGHYRIHSSTRRTTAGQEDDQG
jgi:hypothetical protein